MIIAAIVLAAILLSVIFLYNNLVQKKNAIDNAFFSMDVMLKKRYDLIPQLVETVKGYTLHEKQVLLQLTTMRQRVMEGNLNTNDKVELDNQINTALQSIFVSFENYPELKASQNFLKLQGAINETEEQLAAARRFYNAAVNDYHNAIEMFPGSIIASWMKLRHKTYFNIPDPEKAVPLININ
ncbi:MAG TPA: LemA family protein [Chitinophagaceae bacterium]|nr:LemA family protein [Chitinophagaceae bacterium]